MHCPGQALTLLIELCQGPNLQNQAGASGPLVRGEVGIENESAAVPLAAFCEGGVGSFGGMSRFTDVGGLPPQVREARVCRLASNLYQRSYVH